MSTTFFKIEKEKKVLQSRKRKKERKQLQIKTSLKRICKVRKRLKLILMHNYVTLYFIHRSFFFIFRYLIIVQGK